MSARIIDGKAYAAALRARVGKAASLLKTAHGLVPCIAVVLVGEDQASAIYVSGKNKAAHEAGFDVRDIRQPDSFSEAALLDLVHGLNADPSVHGILVQMPLPPQINASRILEAIDPSKDVDGLTPLNAARLAMGEASLAHGLVACTPQGSLMLIEDVLGNGIAGKHALVIGRSNQVGKPMAQLLLQENATVTVAHSKTRDLPALVGYADIVVAAIGRPEMVRGAWLKPGAVVIDVGMNRIALANGKTKLVGDVAYEEALGIAGAITPVPGGVGPMTIACLMRNTLIAAALQAGLPQPEI